MWFATLLAAGLAAAPLLARLCEIRCGTRAEHCHEATPQAPKGCPEKTHGAEAPSLAATKLTTPATDAAIGPAVAQPAIVPFAEPRFGILPAVASTPPGRDSVAPSVLRL